MTVSHVAFFGHNVGDAAVRRRATAFQRAGLQVTGFMPRRGETRPPDWHNIDLGETRDNAYVHRLAHILKARRQAKAHKELLSDAGLLYARNLDMLMLAVQVRRSLRLDAPIVYECLDVHHRLTGPSTTARLLRRLERRMLAQCALVVISSPRFETEHFALHYPDLCRCVLIENRLIEGDAFAERPAPRTEAPQGPLRIGWFGNLRCRRSLDILLGLARRFPDSLTITLRGYPAPGVFPDFENEVAKIPNVRFLGRYQAPEDLEGIYDGIDLIWAGDWYEAGANSLWLLPNRVYEGGYFATPALAPGGTETARWISDHGAGILIGEPVEARLEERVEALIADRSPIEAIRARLLSLPRSTFVEGPETVKALTSASASARQAS